MSIKKWNEYIREFIENFGNIIDAKMNELNDLVSNVSNGSNFIYQWENKDDNELIVNFSFNEVSIRYEFDIANMLLVKYANGEKDFSQETSSIDDGLNMIEKDIQNIIGISESDHYSDNYADDFIEDMISDIIHGNVLIEDVPYSRVENEKQLDSNSVKDAAKAIFSMLKNKNIIK